MFSLLEGMLPEYAMDGRVRQPVGAAAIATAAPTNTYLCADGKFLCIAGNSDLIFARLMTTIGRAELAKDPAYTTNGDRCARRDELDAVIKRVDCHAAGEGCGGAVLEAADAPCVSRSVRYRRLCRRSAFFWRVAACRRSTILLIGRTLHPGPAIRLDERSGGERGGLDRSAALGAHTD